MTDDAKEQNAVAWSIQTAAEIARDFIAREENLPPKSDSPAEIANRLGIPIGSEGLSLEEVAARVGAVLAATPSAASPRFLNQLFGGRDPAATLAEMLVPLSNTSMYTYKAAGAQVMVEQEVLTRMLAAVPYPDGEGMFSPGGSLANMTAMLIARNEFFPDSRETGTLDQQPVVYTSSEAHYSISKASGILGIGRARVRKVPTGSDGAMLVADLERLIVDDIDAGRRPFFINATAGTTVLGAVDPLGELARVAEEHQLWLHVDGALGASILLSRKYRHLLDGVAASDSLTWNAHKMMGVPLPCSVLLLSRSGLLTRHLGENAEYLFQADNPDLNPGVRSLQCGRRNDALKLWVAWQHHGDDGFDERMTRLVSRAREAGRMVARDDDLELVSEPTTVNVCFRVRGFDSAAICDYLDRNSILKIGFGSAFGGSAIRLVCVDDSLDEMRLEQVLNLIKQAARDLGRRAAVEA